MEFLVTLYRDSLQCNWGFRLEGGRDFKQPLSVQRVFQGTPASSDLLRGDIITSIHNEDANLLFHQEANELIRASGGSLQLGIRRLAGAENQAFQPFQSYKKTMDFGHNFTNFVAPEEEDVSKRYRNSQIEHYKSPTSYLSQTGSPFLPNYQPFTVGECSSVQRKIENRMAPKTDLSFAKPSYPRFNTHNHSPAPYVDRRMIGNIQQNLTRAVHAPHATGFGGFGNAANGGYGSQSKSVPALPRSSHIKVGKYDVKSFSNQVDSFNKGPSIGSNYGSQHGSNHSGVTSPMPQNQSSSPSSQKPKVTIKQYNSPIGLYSNNTLKEELNKQVQFQNTGDLTNANTNSASEF